MKAPTRNAPGRRPPAAGRWVPGRQIATAEKASGVGQTISTVVSVIPGWMKVLLVALAALALGFGVRSLVVGGRARALRRQREQLLGDVSLLEQALLPDALESLGGAGAASVAFRPADGPAAGGDFYDAMTLPGGRGAVLLGDVAGHGRDALAHTAHVRYTLRAYLQAGLGPRMALQLAGRVLDDQLPEGLFATAIIAVHDPAAGTLTYAAAGHPAPIVLGPAVSEPLQTAFSPPLGLGLTTGLRETTVPFANDRVACLFTDGIVEARDAGAPLEREGLADLLTGLPPEDGAARLLERVLAAADHAPDDMTVCVLHAGGVIGGVHIEELEVDAHDVGGDRVPKFLRACGATAEQERDALADAEGLVAKCGGAVVRVQLAFGAADIDVRPPMGDLRVAAHPG